MDGKDKVAQVLRGKRVVDMETLQGAVGQRSRRSIFRDLAQLGYVSSSTLAEKDNRWSLQVISHLDRAERLAIPPDSARNAPS